MFFSLIKTDNCISKELENGKVDVMKQTVVTEKLIITAIINRKQYHYLIGYLILNGLSLLPVKSYIWQKFFCMHNTAFNFTQD